MSNFYKVNTSRGTFREFWWSSRSPVVLLTWLTKLLGISLPCSTDDPPVEDVWSFQVAEDSLPEEVKARFQPMMEELAASGFERPIFHFIPDTSRSTKIYWATFRHSSGNSFARIHHRIWTTPHPPKIYLFPMFVSAFHNGTFLLSTAGKPDMEMPAMIRINRIVGASVSALWESHQKELAQQAGKKSVYSMRDAEELRGVIEHLHIALRDFHLRRGVFAPMTEMEKQAAQTFAENASSGGEHAEVLAELEQLQRKKPGWVNALVILAISALLFVGAGAARWSWKTVALLVPILFFHELGHFIAMRIFRYRNLRMFFIPLFGAAVTGQNFNVPGWKKAIVSLMGPVPGIFAGTIIGVVGLVLKNALLLKIGIMTLILNGLNLAPVLPLDGGWILHATLFSRHPLLDAGFRLVAALGLIGIGLLTHDRVLPYLSIPMFLGLPVAYRVAKIASQLRARGIPAASPDAQTVPPDTARVIITELKAAFPKGMNNKILAQHTLAVFESLNARPPNWLATAGLLAAQFGSLVFAIIFVCLFFVAKTTDLGKFVSAAAFAPQNKFECNSIQRWSGAEAAKAENLPQNTIVTTFTKASDAEQTYAKLTGKLPAAASLEKFGQTLLLALPADDSAARKRWFAELQVQSTNLFVDSTNYRAALSLVCIAPTEEAARQIEAEAVEYFLASSMHLIPPWIPKDSRSPSERQQHQKARHTYARLQKNSYDWYSAPELKELQKKTNTAQREGDHAEVQRLQKQHKEISKTLQQKQLETIRAEGPRKIDPELITLYAALPRESTNYLQALRSLGVRMGQLPLENGKPSVEDDRYSTHYASIDRNGLMLSFHWMSFGSLMDGLPAFTDWLCARGCLQFKYDFKQGGVPDYDELDEN